MIRIHKECPPEKLDDGAVRSHKDCAAYDKNGDDYRTGAKKFKFDRGIYGHSTVKDALIRSQHRKCCYCESKFEAHAGGDIEHYRPKGAVRQGENSERLYPGYFWLAYTWKNLYWCCQMCNRSNKKDLFPLCNDERRARSPVENLEDEKPLILDPGDDSNNPRCHIKFRDELAIPNTMRGKKTIEVVGLNRGALIEERLSLLKTVRMLNNIACHSEDVQDVQDARSELEEYARPEAEYSAMTNDFLQAHG